MRGASQASYLAVEDGFEPVLVTAGTEAAALGEQMFAVVDLLDHSAALRRALSNPARTAADKAALAQSLLGGKVDERVVEVLAGLARHRWSVEIDLVEALERMAAETVLASAQATGDLERVEEELFRFDRFLAHARRVRDALTDRLADPAARARLVRDLLDGKVHPVTLQLVERCARTPRGRTMTRSLSDLGRLAAHRRRLLPATVCGEPAQVAQGASHGAPAGRAGAPLDELESDRVHLAVEEVAHQARTRRRIGQAISQGVPHATRMGQEPVEPEELLLHPFEVPGGLSRCEHCLGGHPFERLDEVDLDRPPVSGQPGHHLDDTLVDLPAEQVHDGEHLLAESGCLGTRSHEDGLEPVLDREVRRLADSAHQRPRTVPAPGTWLSASTDAASSSRNRSITRD